MTTPAVLIGVDIVSADRLSRAAERGGATFARHLTTLAERDRGLDAGDVPRQGEPDQGRRRPPARLQLARLRGRAGAAARPGPTGCSTRPPPNSPPPPAWP